MIKSLFLAASLTFALAGAPARTSAQEAAAYQTSANQVLLVIETPASHAQAGAGIASGYGDELGRSARRRTAGRLARKHGLTVVADWPMPLIAADCFILSVPDGRSALDEAERLSREPGVAKAEVNHLYRTQSGPARNDPLYMAQPAAVAWRLSDLHEISTGRNVKVAVIDSMVDRDHPDLAGQSMVVQNFVANRPARPEGHGTGVAGVIAARADNGVGIVGVAPQAKLMALRACWEVAPGDGGTVCDTLSLAQALHYAIDHDAQVINLSLSGPPDYILSKLIDAALKKGIQVVAAYDRKAAEGGFPASHPGVIAVLDEGPAPPPSNVYAAPGRSVPTTGPGGRWDVVNGSSFAAAHVTGLMALLDEESAAARRSGGSLVKASSGEIDTCAVLLRATRRPNSACARYPTRTSPHP